MLSFTQHHHVFFSLSIALLTLFSYVHLDSSSSGVTFSDVSSFLKGTYECRTASTAYKRALVLSSAALEKISSSQRSFSFLQHKQNDIRQVAADLRLASLIAPASLKFPPEAFARDIFKQIFSFRLNSAIKVAYIPFVIGSNNLFLEFRRTPPQNTVEIFAYYNEWNQDNDQNYFKNSIVDTSCSTFSIDTIVNSFKQYSVKELFGEVIPVATHETKKLQLFVKNSYLSPWPFSGIMYFVADRLGILDSQYIYYLIATDLVLSYIDRCRLGTSDILAKPSDFQSPSEFMSLLHDKRHLLEMYCHHLKRCGALFRQDDQYDIDHPDMTLFPLTPEDDALIKENDRKFDAALEFLLGFHPSTVSKMTNQYPVDAYIAIPFVSTPFLFLGDFIEPETSNVLPKDVKFLYDNTPIQDPVEFEKAIRSFMLSTSNLYPSLPTFVPYLNYFILHFLEKKIVVTPGTTTPEQCRQYVDLIFSIENLYKTLMSVTDPDAVDLPLGHPRKFHRPVTFDFMTVMAHVKLLTILRNVLVVIDEDIGVLREVPIEKILGMCNNVYPLNLEQESYMTDTSPNYVYSEWNAKPTVKITSVSDELCSGYLWGFDQGTSDDDESTFHYFNLKIGTETVGFQNAFQYFQKKATGLVKLLGTLFYKGVAVDKHKPGPEDVLFPGYSVNYYLFHQSLWCALKGTRSLQQIYALECLLDMLFRLRFILGVTPESKPFFFMELDPIGHKEVVHHNMMNGKILSSSIFTDLTKDYTERTNFSENNYVKVTGDYLKFGLMKSPYIAVPLMMGYFKEYASYLVDDCNGTSWSDMSDLDFHVLINHTLFHKQHSNTFRHLFVNIFTDPERANFTTSIFPRFLGILENSSTRALMTDDKKTSFYLRVLIMRIKSVYYQNEMIKFMTDVYDNNGSDIYDFHCLAIGLEGLVLQNGNKISQKLLIMVMASYACAQFNLTNVQSSGENDTSKNPYRIFEGFKDLSVMSQSLSVIHRYLPFLIARDDIAAIAEAAFKKFISIVYPQFKLNTCTSSHIFFIDAQLDGRKYFFSFLTAKLKEISSNALTVSSDFFVAQYLNMNSEILLKSIAKLTPKFREIPYLFMGYYSSRLEFFYKGCPISFWRQRILWERDALEFNGIIYAKHSLEYYNLPFNGILLKALMDLLSERLLREAIPMLKTRVISNITDMESNPDGFFDSVKGWIPNFLMKPFGRIFPIISSIQCYFLKCLLTLLDLIEILFDPFWYIDYMNPVTFVDLVGAFNHKYDIWHRFYRRFLVTSCGDDGKFAILFELDNNMNLTIRHENYLKLGSEFLHRTLQVSFVYDKFKATVYAADDANQVSYTWFDVFSIFADNYFYYQLYDPKTGELIVVFPWLLFTENTPLAFVRRIVKPVNEPSYMSKFQVKIGSDEYEVVDDLDAVKQSLTKFAYDGMKHLRHRLIPHLLLKKKGKDDFSYLFAPKIDPINHKANAISCIMFDFKVFQNAQKESSYCFIAEASLENGMPMTTKLDPAQIFIIQYYMMLGKCFDIAYVLSKQLSHSKSILEYKVSKTQSDSPIEKYLSAAYYRSSAEASSEWNFIFYSMIPYLHVNQILFKVKSPLRFDSFRKDFETQARIVPSYLFNGFSFKDMQASIAQISNPGFVRKEAIKKDMPKFDVVSKDTLFDFLNALFIQLGTIGLTTHNELAKALLKDGVLLGQLLPVLENKIQDLFFELAQQYEDSVTCKWYLVKEVTMIYLKNPTIDTTKDDVFSKYVYARFCLKQLLAYKASLKRPSDPTIPFNPSDNFHQFCLHRSHRFNAFWYHYDLDKYFFITIFEAFHSFIIIYANQWKDINAMTNKVLDDKNFALQKMMGAGKTAVLSTVMSYVLFHLGYNAHFISPSGLVANNAAELAQGLDLLGLKVVQLSCSRTELMRNDNLLNQLLFVTERADQFRLMFVSSSGFIQSLQNTFSQLFIEDKLGEDQFLLYESLHKPLFKLLCIFSTHTVAMIDEGDSILDPKQELNFPTDRSLSIPSSIIRMIGFLHGFYSKHFLTPAKLSKPDETKILSEIFKLFDRINEASCNYVSNGQFYDELHNSSYFDLFSTPNCFNPYEEDDKRCNCGKSKLTLVYYAKRIFPHVYSHECNLNYGLSQQIQTQKLKLKKVHPDKDHFPQLYYSIPYESASTPKEGSSFSDPWRTMGFTFETFLRFPVHPDLVLKAFKSGRNLYKFFVEQNVKKEDIMSSNSMHLYAQIFDNLEIDHFDMNLAIKRLSNDPLLNVSLVHETLFTEFELKPDQIYNVPLNTPSAFLHFITYSGTFENLNILPKTLNARNFDELKKMPLSNLNTNNIATPISNADLLAVLNTNRVTSIKEALNVISEDTPRTPQWNAHDRRILKKFVSEGPVNMAEGLTIESRIKQSLLQKEATVRRLNIARAKNIADILIESTTPNDELADICNYNAIIDVGAGFKDFLPKELAFIIMRKCPNLSGIVYSEPVNGKYEWQLMRCLTCENELWKGVSDSIRDEIRSGMFVIYDHARTVGSDFKLADRAMALVVMSEQVTLSALMQGIMRLRQFLNGVDKRNPKTANEWKIQKINQRVVFGLPKTMPSIASLQSWIDIWNMCRTVSDKITKGDNLLLIKQHPVVRVAQELRLQLNDFTAFYSDTTFECIEKNLQKFFKDINMRIYDPFEFSDLTTYRQEFENFFDPLKISGAPVGFNMKDFTTDDSVSNTDLNRVRDESGNGQQEQEQEEEQEQQMDVELGGEMDELRQDILLNGAPNYHPHIESELDIGNFKRLVQFHYSLCDEIPVNVFPNNGKRLFMSKNYEKTCTSFHPHPDYTVGGKFHKRLRFALIVEHFTSYNMIFVSHQEAVHIITKLSTLARADPKFPIFILLDVLSHVILATNTNSTVNMAKIFKEHWQLHFAATIYAHAYYSFFNNPYYKWNLFLWRYRLHEVFPNVIAKDKIKSDCEMLTTHLQKFPKDLYCSKISAIEKDLIMPLQLKQYADRIIFTIWDKNHELADPLIEPLSAIVITGIFSFYRSVPHADYPTRMLDTVAKFLPVPVFSDSLETDDLNTLCSGVELPANPYDSLTLVDSYFDSRRNSGSSQDVSPEFSSEIPLFSIIFSFFIKKGVETVKVYFEAQPILTICVFVYVPTLLLPYFPVFISLIVNVFWLLLTAVFFIVRQLIENAVALLAPDAEIIDYFGVNDLLDPLTGEEITPEKRQQMQAILDALDEKKKLRLKEAEQREVQKKPLKGKEQETAQGENFETTDAHLRPCSAIFIVLSSAFVLV